MKRWKWINIDRGSMLVTDDESVVVLSTQKKVCDSTTFRMIEHTPVMYDLLKSVQAIMSDGASVDLADFETKLGETLKEIEK